ARARSAAVWAAESPRKPAPAVSRHHGARAPPSHGRHVTPRAPGGLVAATSARAAAPRPVNEPTHASSDPAAARPPSRSHPSIAARVRTSGGRSSADSTGNDTFAVVPHDTIGRAVHAAVPRTSHCRSPAPAMTTVEAGTPTSLA